MQSENKQEIYLEAVFDTDTQFDKRNTMYNKSAMRISYNEEELGKIEENFSKSKMEEFKFDGRESILTKSLNTIDDDKFEIQKQIEETKKKIDQIENENLIFKSKLDNFSSNNRLATSKSKGKISII